MSKPSLILIGTGSHLHMAIEFEFKDILQYLAGDRSAYVADPNLTALSGRLV